MEAKMETISVTPETLDDRLAKLKRELSRESSQGFEGVERRLDQIRELQSSNMNQFMTLMVVTIAGLMGLLVLTVFAE